MSDVENLDVMLGSYQRDNRESQNGNNVHERSDRREEGFNQNENDYRSYLNTNLSENSLTVETSRAISSEISSQMSKKFEEIQTNLNSQILDVNNAAIETKVLPSIKNAVKSQNSAKNTRLDLRSDGLHPNNLSQVLPQKDFQSNRLYPENVSHVAEDVQNDFTTLVTMRTDRINHCRENSVDSNQRDDDGYDSVVETVFCANRKMDVSIQERNPGTLCSAVRVVTSENLVC